MTVFKSIASVLILLIWHCASLAVNAQNQSTSHIRGVITKLNRSATGNGQQNKLLGSILVEREAGAGGDYDKADVKITSESRIYTQADQDKRTLLTIDSLKLNQRVAVRFSPGPALLSYPIQVRATEIIILPASSGSSKNTGNPTPDGSPQIPDSEMAEVRRAIDAGNAVWVAAWAKGDADLMRDLMQKRGGKAKLTVTTTDVWLDGDTAYEPGYGSL